MKGQSRRAFLAATTGGVGVLAGCTDMLTGSGSDARDAALEGADDDDDDDADDDDAEPGTDGTDDGENAADLVDEDIDLPLRTVDVPLGYELSALEEDAVSGGVPQDGIPSIDDPVYDDVDHGDDMLQPGDPVFGIEIDGIAKAYPQHVLVYHEIVNDTVEGKGVAVTYCPLTGTAIGFERGDVEFGVSGRLVNSNLIMYDRATDSWWPQIHAESPLGALEGSALKEFRVTWSTWERWKETYPETEVLTEDTGAARNYGTDPYGQYNPDGGYYTSDTLLFGPRNENDDYHPKEVFVGARSDDGAVAFLKDTLREDNLLEATLSGTPYLAAYHHDLDSAWVYRNPGGDSVEVDRRGYVGADGTVYDADDLPLESVNAFDAFWFAWYGFYPNTEVVA